MGVRYPSVVSTTVANALPANATETVICTVAAINPAVDFAQILLQWMAFIQAGTNCTGLLFKLRRGTTTGGTQLGFNWQQTVVAGNFALCSGVYVDTPGIVANEPYSLTCTQTAATGAGSLSDVCLAAFCL